MRVMKELRELFIGLMALAAIALFAAGFWGAIWLSLPVPACNKAAADTETGYPSCLAGSSVSRRN